MSKSTEEIDTQSYSRKLASYEFNLFNLVRAGTQRLVASENDYTIQNLSRSKATEERLGAGILQSDAAKHQFEVQRSRYNVVPFKFEYFQSLLPDSPAKVALRSAKEARNATEPFPVQSIKGQFNAHAPFAERKATMVVHKMKL